MRSPLGLPRAVVRRARRARRALSGGVATADASPVQDPAGRLAAALALVAEAEAHSGELPHTSEAVELWARDRVVRRPQLQPSVAALLPVGQREGWGADAPRVQTLTAAVAADLVVTAKFDIRDRVKLRAAYADARRTLATQPAVGDGADGIARAVLAHEIVSRHAPGLIPPLLGHGSLAAGQPYLVETWLEGEPLVTGVRLAAAAPEIVAGLSRVHLGHGVEHAPPTAHWGALDSRWADTVATGIVPAELADWVGSLLAREATVRCSWVHGDLVASNVMQTPSGIALIDWEHSRVAPVMNDGAKLHLFSRDPAGTLEVVLAGLGGSVPGGPGAHRPVEELALAHAHLLSRYPRRRAELAGHPRAAVYEKQVRRQVERLLQVRAAA